MRNCVVYFKVVWYMWSKVLYGSLLCFVIVVREHTTVTNEARQCPDMESFVFLS